jgi:hypothetical protein
MPKVYREKSHDHEHSIFNIICTTSGAEAFGALKHLQGLFAGGFFARPF